MGMEVDAIQAHVRKRDFLFYTPFEKWSLKIVAYEKCLLSPESLVRSATYLWLSAVAIAMSMRYSNRTIFNTSF